jgi:hypothetical protein
VRTNRFNSEMAAGSPLSHESQWHVVTSYLVYIAFSGILGILVPANCPCGHIPAWAFLTERHEEFRILFDDNIITSTSLLG